MIMTHILNPIMTETNIIFNTVGIMHTNSLIFACFFLKKDFLAVQTEINWYRFLIRFSFYNVLSLTLSSFNQIPLRCRCSWWWIYTVTSITGSTSVKYVLKYQACYTISTDCYNWLGFEFKCSLAFKDSRLLFKWLWLFRPLIFKNKIFVLKYWI